MSEFFLSFYDKLSEYTWLNKLIFESLKGAKNAVIYSFQVRAPDVLLVALFAGKKSRKMLKLASLAATRQTGYLALFVFLYRVFSGCIRHKMGSLSPKLTFCAAACASLLVYRRTGPDSMQLLFFLLARLLSALCNYGVQKKFLPSPPYIFYPFLYSIVGGLLFCLFEHHPTTLTPNLRYSMRYLYKI